VILFSCFFHKIRRDASGKRFLSVFLYRVRYSERKKNQDSDTFNHNFIRKDFLDFLGYEEFSYIS
jgi:hypothetical protein